MKVNAENDSLEVDKLLIDLDLGNLQGYEFKSVRGRGRRGVVCHYQTKDGEEVAVKFLIAPPDQNIVDNFRNEVAGLALNSKVLRDSRGSRVIPKPLSDVLKHPKYPVFYFLMDYVEGRTLKEIYDSQRLTGSPFDPWASIDLMARIAFALVSFHALGWVHMDLNMGNIMIKSKYQVDEGEGRVTSSGISILDLGYARNSFELLWDDPEVLGRKPFFLFKPFGDPYLSALELLQDPSKATHQADAFTLGAIFYLLLTGEYPFQAASFKELVEKKAEAVFDDVVTGDGKLDIFLRHFFRRQLSPNPGSRFHVGQIRTMMEDLRFRRTHEMGEDFIRTYFAYGGAVMRCVHCLGIMHPVLTHGGDRCPRCGFTVQPGDGWLDWRINS